MRMALEAKQENVHETEPNQYRCVFCLENEATGVGVPCGHALYCRNCAEDVITHTDYAFLFYDEEDEQGNVYNEDELKPVTCPICRCLIFLLNLRYI